MELLKLEELQPLIIEWAKDKGLLFEENAPKQRLKLIEECGELASAILKNDVKLQKDAIGDIFVVLVILAEQVGEKIILNNLEFGNYGIDNSICINYIISNSYIDFNNKVFFSLEWLFESALNLKLDLTECANIAWNEIKDRKGKTLGGTFIKES